jgi:hypothetical protein
MLPTPRNGENGASKRRISSLALASVAAFLTERHRRRRGLATRLPALLLGLFGAMGCSPVVDATFSDIEIGRSDIPVPGAPAAGVSTVGFQFTFASGQLGANTNPEAQSRIRQADLRELSIVAKTGVSDLSFIQTLHAVAFVPLSKSTNIETTRQVEIADYQRRDTASVGKTFKVPLPEPVDLLPLLRPSSTEPAKVVVSVSLGGQLPTVGWTTDVSMVLSVSIHE